MKYELLIFNSHEQQQQQNEGAIWHSAATQWKVRGIKKVLRQTHGVTVCGWGRRARQGVALLRHLASKAGL
jgi:hypothetical protein